MFTTIIVTIPFITSNWISIAIGGISFLLGILAIVTTIINARHQIQARHWDDSVDLNFKIVKFGTRAPQLPDNVQTLEPFWHSFNETWVSYIRTLDGLQPTFGVRDYELVGITDIKNNTIKLMLRGKEKDNYRRLTLRLASILSCIKKHKVWVTFYYLKEDNDVMRRGIKQKKVKWSGGAFDTIELHLDNLGLKLENIVFDEERLVGNIIITFNRFSKAIPINVFTKDYKRYKIDLESKQKCEKRAEELNILHRIRKERSENA